MKNEKTIGRYVSPRVERIDIETERGFAASIAGGGADNDGIFGGYGFGSGISGAGSDDDGLFE